MSTCGSSTGKHGSNRNTWNANSWPFESSRVIAALARVLHTRAYFGYDICPSPRC